MQGIHTVTSRLENSAQILPCQLKFVLARTAEKMTVDEMPVDKMASCHFGGKGSFTLALFAALSEAK